MPFQKLADKYRGVKFVKVSAYFGYSAVDAWYIPRFVHQVACILHRCHICEASSSV